MLNDNDQSTGYSDWITDVAFFAISTVCCTALGAILAALFFPEVFS